MRRSILVSVLGGLLLCVEAQSQVKIEKTTPASFSGKIGNQIRMLPGQLHYLDDKEIHYSITPNRTLIKKRLEAAGISQIVILGAGSDLLTYDPKLGYFESRNAANKIIADDKAQQAAKEAAVVAREQARVKREREQDDARIRQLAQELQRGKHLVRLGSIQLSQQSTHVTQTTTIVENLGRGTKVVRDISFPKEVRSPTVYAWIPVENPTDSAIAVSLQLRVTFLEDRRDFLLTRFQEVRIPAKGVIGPRSIGEVFVAIDCNTESTDFATAYTVPPPGSPGSPRGKNIGRVGEVEVTQILAQVK